MFDPAQRRRASRDKGAEWYQIYLAERLVRRVGGDGDLYDLLLALFIHNEEGHLRYPLTEEQQKTLAPYPGLTRGDRSPLVLSGEGTYLYTRKRKTNEDRFIGLLEELIGGEPSPWEEGRGLSCRAGEDVMRLYRGLEKHRIFIVTGGPGTGKTTLVAGLMDLLGDGASRGMPSLRIALAAPTGRAAKRVEEGLAGKEGSEESAQTLHKLLGIDYKSGEPGYHRKNPLPYDLVIVDEASMVDLRIMTLLLEALSPRARLLLVGDKDQLPPVEAGALLADFLSRVDEESHRLKDRVMVLEKVYRSNRVIIDLARKVIGGEKQSVLESMKRNRDEVSWHPLPRRMDLLYGKLAGAYRSEISRGPGSSEGEALRWFDAYNRLMVLTPSRKGWLGTERLNGEIMKRLNPLSLHGVPIMMTRNDYDLGLFNGDRGVILKRNGEYHAFFADPIRHYPLAFLGRWEYCWAQTIHKSQGSEFDRVHLILPPGRPLSGGGRQPERMLTREIFYTGLTRAKDRVDIYGGPEAVAACLDSYVERHSRIREVLKAAPSPGK